MKPTKMIAGRYELIQKLSSPSSQTRQTFLAQDSRTHERVVVKIIQPSTHFNEQWLNLKLFERESKILAALDHPAIAQYRAAFETDIEGTHSFVLVQTYCEAPSLERLIRSGRRFSEAEVVNLAERLLSILSYLHAQTPPVIHRDIKPSNILRGEQGDVYLIDFGAVHTDLTKESGTITIVGSYGYIPLEQFSGHAVPASDLYSLGMTLIYLITGTHPADMAFVEGTIQLPHCALNSSLNPSTIQWLKRMSSADLKQRFSTAEQALGSLKSPAISQGCYQGLRPEGTKIVLEREGDRLRITIPKSRRTLSCQLKIGIHITAVVALFWGVHRIGLIGLIMPILLVLFAGSPLIPLVNTLVKRILKLLPPPRQQSIVDINRAEGICTGFRSHPTAAVTWHQQCSRVQDLDLLAYTPGYQLGSYEQGNKTISHGKTPPALSVQAGQLTYTIGHSQLSALEFWWLGQELSDFLDLTLQTIYPVPTVNVSSTDGY